MVNIHRFQVANMWVKTGTLVKIVHNNLGYKNKTM